MFRCPRAALASPFRLRFFRFATPPNVPLPSKSSSSIRPGPRPAVLAAAAAGAALVACADSVWEPLPPGTGREDGRPMAAVVSETRGFLADIDSLPSWRKVIHGMAEPGCAFHFRRVAGSYAAKEYGLEYSRKATAKAEAWKALVYNVLVTVSRPAEGGGTEVLPERLAIRAVCAMPDTKWGTDEAKGRTEAILEAHGIKFPGADRAQARTPAEVPRALTVLRRAVGRLGPRPLLAEQAHGCAEYDDARNCPMEEITATVRRPVNCSAGFDYEATTGECERNTLGGGSPGTGTPGNPGSSGGGNTNTNTPTARTVDFELSCSAPTRGQSGSCSVSAPDSAGVNLGALNYSWSSTIGTATVGTEPNGGSSWSGTATENVNVTVQISDPAGLIAGATASAAVSVSARNWGLPHSNAKPTYEDLGPDWGLFTANVPTVSAGSGTGPWSGRPYVAATGNFGTMLRFVPDLHPDTTKRPSYGTREGNAVLLAFCENAATLEDEETMAGVNDHCGTSSAYEAWVAEVDAHEREHESNYNVCAASHEFTYTIFDIEATLADQVGDAVDDWNEFVAELDAGMDDGVGKREATVWNHHSGFWYTEALVLGHEGSPCPH